MTTATHDAIQTSPVLAHRSEKIARRHLDRLAMVYVRQSTAHQVLEHQESTRMQYQLKERAEALGWADDRVVVIDDDLAKGVNGAAGNQRREAAAGINVYIQPTFIVCGGAGDDPETEGRNRRWPVVDGCG